MNITYTLPASVQDSIVNQDIELTRTQYFRTWGEFKAHLAWWFGLTPYDLEDCIINDYLEYGTHVI